MATNKVPESAEGAGDQQMVYELTASGLAANWIRDAPFFNDNRLPSSRCDTRSDGNYNNICKFPFMFEGVLYNTCTMADASPVPWCYFQVDKDLVGVGGMWGQCGSMINNAPSNYGELEMDFVGKKVTMKIWTPGSTSGSNGLADEYVYPGSSTVIRSSGFFYCHFDL